MSSTHRSFLGVAALLLAAVLWVLGSSEAPPDPGPLGLVESAAHDPRAPLWIRLQAARRSAAEASRSGAATFTASEPEPAEPAPGSEAVADLALLVLGPDGPRAEQRLELWRIEGSSASDAEGAQENLIALGVDSTDARGWLLWPALPYGRYLVCLPPAPGQRGYRGPGVTGRRLLELEHRADLLAERVLELEP